MPVVLCNVAACCLKLGDEGRVDLIHDAHLRVFMSEKAWYLYCNQYATQALSMEPEAKIAYKVRQLCGVCLKYRNGIYLSIQWAVRSVFSMEELESNGS